MPFTKDQAMKLCAEIHSVDDGDTLNHGIHAMMTQLSANVCGVRENAVDDNQNKWAQNEPSMKHVRGNNGNSIVLNKNRSDVKVNGAPLKRKPVSSLNSFNKNANFSDKAFNKLANEQKAWNLDPNSLGRESPVLRKIIESVMAKKAAKNFAALPEGQQDAITHGRLRNDGKAASTINIPKDRQPKGGTAVNIKFDDGDSYVDYVKRAAVAKAAAETGGHELPDTDAAKTISRPKANPSLNPDKPAIRLGVPSGDATKAAIAAVANKLTLFPTPPQIPQVDGMTRTQLPQPNVLGKQKDGRSIGADTYKKFPNLEPQQFPHKVRTNNIEAGPII